ncbi:hypothetical protein SOVF_045900 [Spinacia oleracea]|nr:hypothetical protein SOVF_045900 [Spinacia oleracea]
MIIIHNYQLFVCFEVLSQKPSVNKSIASKIRHIVGPSLYVKASSPIIESQTNSYHII